MRRSTAAPRSGRPRHPYAFAVALAAGSATVALLCAALLDLPVRDPDGVAGPAWVRLPVVVALFLLADVVPRAVRRAGQARGLGPATRAVLRERWSGRRSGLTAVGLASFLVCYLAYRNLKSFLPFARDGVRDEALLRLDRAMGLGLDPATRLHDLLGTGPSAHVLSVVYLLYLAFVPLSLAAALVWTRDPARGSWYVTALCLNWSLGAASYYLVPSLGPVFAEPTLFAELPRTGVTLLQETLLEHRREVLADPWATGAVHGIAGFASLHTSIVLTGALMAQRLRLPAAVRVAAWVFFVLTVLATVYFGWHYLVDDVAGVAIAFCAVWVAGVATGQLRDDARSRVEVEPGAAVTGVASPP